MHRAAADGSPAQGDASLRAETATLREIRQTKFLLLLACALPVDSELGRPLTV
jgi:hypothetical protein